jgi:hypothetical protein
MMVTIVSQVQTCHLSVYFDHGSTLYRIHCITMLDFLYIFDVFAKIYQPIKSLKIPKGHLYLPLQSCYNNIIVMANVLKNTIAFTKTIHCIAFITPIVYHHKVVLFFNKPCFLWFSKLCFDNFDLNSRFVAPSVFV